MIFDDPTKKKAGMPIEGFARYRHDVDAARQAYRMLRGANVVVGRMHLPLTRRPGHSFSAPVGLALFLKSAQAQALHVPYCSVVRWPVISSGQDKTQPQIYAIDMPGAVEEGVTW